MANHLDAVDKTDLSGVNAARFANMEGGIPTTCGVEYSRSDGGTVSFHVPGADIQRDALLLGVSSKRDDETQRGNFGEGLKLGVLALLRCGKGARIETPRETWTARLEEHDSFPGRKVLVFHTRTRTKPGDGVRVEVSGIDRENYEQMRETFLCFRPPKLSATDGYYGTVLFDPDRRGQIFVKGVLVQTDPKLTYGYDLSKASVDRDRKMVNQWDSRFAMANILAAARQQSNTVDVLALMEADAPEMSDSSYVTAVQQQVLTGFIEKYGENVYPCANMAEAQELEHSGVKAIPVPKVLLDTLRTAGLDANAAKAENLKAPSRVWALQDLTLSERSALQWGIHQLAAAAESDPERVLARLKVVDFKAPALLGLHRGSDICVSRTLLGDRYELLATLVHEWAHDAGGDAAVGHVQTMEKLWVRIARKIST